jgi:hypothetical protein
MNNEDIDGIQVVTLEKFIKEHMQGTTECFRIGNSSSQKKFTLNFSAYTFIVFIKYKKSRDENELESEPGDSTPPGGAGPLLVTPPYGVSASQPVSVRFSSMPSFRCLIFADITPGLPEVCISFSHRVLFRSISVRSCSQF